MVDSVNHLLKMLPSDDDSSPVKPSRHRRVGEKVSRLASSKPATSGPFYDLSNAQVSGEWSFWSADEEDVAWVK